MLQIFIFGIFMVFLVFLVLFFFSMILSTFSKQKKSVISEGKKSYEGEEEIVAVISAVLAQMMEGEYRIVSIKPKKKKRGFEAWTKRGWRRRKWSESSEW
ncbi:hypothetical protein [Thermotoga sp. KOL6]|uniref:hypothetical protein n=1 Tax=Thermotoga sp. KOL6 TaxID=126741 RepID=UPI000C784A46|nr:hypothetical protein [Thermotoga sp. KOL6]PLV59416.1 hypothetical protein AS005_06670 [Thermotoga sp. KOL6]